MGWSSLTVNGFAFIFVFLVASVETRPTHAVLKAVDEGRVVQLSENARKRTLARPVDAEALALYTLCVVWRQRLGMAQLGRRPDYEEARSLKSCLEIFKGKPNLNLRLARIQFDRDFGIVLLDPGEGKYKEGWETAKGVLPDGTVKYHRIRTFDLIGPSDEDVVKQHARIEQVIQMAPNDPEVLLLRASIAAKAKPEVAGQILARAEEAGVEQIQPLSTRILAWKIRRNPTEKAKLIAYVQRTQNDRVTRTALRGNPELAKLAGIKP